VKTVKRSEAGKSANYKRRNSGLSFRQGRLVKPGLVKPVYSIRCRSPTRTKNNGSSPGTKIIFYILRLMFYQ
jgi:hypothetical protein